MLGFYLFVCVCLQNVPLEWNQSCVHGYLWRTISSSLIKHEKDNHSYLRSQFEEHRIKTLAFKLVVIHSPQKRMYFLSDSQFWITLLATLIKSKLLTYHKEKDYFEPQLYIQFSFTNFPVEIRSSMNLKMCSQNSLTLLVFSTKITLTATRSLVIWHYFFFSGISPPFMQMFYVL